MVTFSIHNISTIGLANLDYEKGARTCARAETIINDPNVNGWASSRNYRQILNSIALVFPEL